MKNCFIFYYGSVSQPVNSCCNCPLPKAIASGGWLQQDLLSCCSYLAVDGVNQFLFKQKCPQKVFFSKNFLLLFVQSDGFWYEPITLFRVAWPFSHDRYLKWHPSFLFSFLTRQIYFFPYYISDYSYLPAIGSRYIWREYFQVVLDKD